MQHNGWDRALKVTSGGTGLVGHAGTVLLRKACDQAGLTAQLGSALRKARKPPFFDRGAVLASMAVAIALGALSTALGERLELSTLRLTAGCSAD